MNIKPPLSRLKLCSLGTFDDHYVIRNLAAQTGTLLYGGCRGASGWIRRIADKWEANWYSSVVVVTVQEPRGRSTSCTPATRQTLSFPGIYRCIIQVQDDAMGAISFGSVDKDLSPCLDLSEQWACACLAKEQAFELTDRSMNE